jgi:hypothetical protein
MQPRLSNQHSGLTASSNPYMEIIDHRNICKTDAHSLYVIARGSTQVKDAETQTYSLGQAQRW